MKKRLVSIILAGVMILSLTACGSGASEQKQEATPEEAAEATDVAVEAEEAGNAGEAAGSDKEYTIGYSMKTLQEERWQRELECCQKYADELGVNFVYQVANNDSDLQISQIENLITQGVDAILVTPVDSGALSTVLKDASDQGIKVIGYDQECEGVEYDAYVGYSAYEIGKQFSQMAIDAGVTKGNFVFLYGDSQSGTAVENMKQGMWDTLQEYIDAGDIKVVMDQYCKDWSAESGLAHTENAISTYGEDIAAVICMNDGIANGAIQALTAAGMENKGIVVTGQDCELTAVQRIIAGTQTATLYKDSDKLAQKVMNAAYATITGGDIGTSDTIDIGGIVSPWVIADTIVVDKNTYQSVIIDGGVFTEEELATKAE